MAPKGDTRRPDDCPQKRIEGERGFGEGPPLTPGREFAVEPVWNLWFDGEYTNTADRRHGVDLDGQGANITIGADRLITGTLVLGASMGVEYNHTDEFRGISKVESLGVSISPYVAFEVLPHWTLDAQVGFAWIENDDKIGPLKAEYSSQRYDGSVTATGDYTLGARGINVRPKLSVYYAHTENADYDTQGSVRGRRISVHTNEDRYNFGVADFSVEVNRSFTLPSGIVLVPYVEVGASYEFERPNDGKILTSDLTLVDSSPWSGQVHVGVRALLTSSFFIELKGAYLTLGQNDLDVWSAGLFLSYGF